LTSSSRAGISESVGVPVVASGGAGHAGTHGRRAAGGPADAVWRRAFFTLANTRRRRETISGKQKHSCALMNEPNGIFIPLAAVVGWPAQTFFMTIAWYGHLKPRIRHVEGHPGELGHRVF